MDTMELNGQWQLQYRRACSVGQSALEQTWATVAAMVPGVVELDLMRAGRLPDITQGNHIYRTLELESYEWKYSRVIRLPKTWDVDQPVELIFEGIDTLATIRLNGEVVGQTQNMFIAHRLDVTGKLLRDADNILEVHLHPVVPYARQKTLSATVRAQEVNWESLCVRKAGHMYGWDIAPRLVSAGLWRGVRLQQIPGTRFRSVYWATIKVDTDHRTAMVMLDWDMISDVDDLYALQLSIDIKRTGRSIHSSARPVLGTHGKYFLALDDVDFWWPRGQGEAALYEATLILHDADGQELSKNTQNIGIRTIQLSRTELTTPTGEGDFAFIVNGRRIYIKGTNWVPLDALHARDPQHLQATLDMALELNCNMLRCWGGSVYEDHAFFDWCDANGMLVWQDFAMACGIYPQDEQFAAQIRDEAQAVVTKLRNHPSLALWCGNNENDQAYASWSPLVQDPNVHDKLSRQVLPDVTHELDPCREYLPSSPYYSPELMKYGVPHDMRPEDHLWGPRNDFKGEFYLSSNAHFVSEIGYHGCPDVQSMRDMLDPEYLWPWQDNDQWLTKAVRPVPTATAYNYRIELMAKQIAVLFADEPKNLEDFVMASQISQAEALKFFIEKWRSEKGRRWGMLWWNLRDCWPIISDAVVDYYGRRKLAYDYIKASQREVCSIVTEPDDGQHQLVVVNDLPYEVEGSVCLRDGVTDQILGEASFLICANDKQSVASIAAVGVPSLWLMQTRINTCQQFVGNHYIAGPRPFELNQYRDWLLQIKANALCDVEYVR